MIEEMKAAYIKNPNRSFFGIAIISWILLISLQDTICLIGAFLMVCNSYAILKVKNRSMWLMLFSLGIIHFAYLFLENHTGKEEMTEEIEKKKINYNINGNCTFNGKPCQMFKDVGICDCETCELNPNKEG